MKKYLDLISEDATEVAQQDLQFKAEDAQHSVAIALLETRKEIANQEKLLNAAMRAVPYNLQAEIDITIKIENLKKGLSIATTISKERF